MICLMKLTFGVDTDSGNASGTDMAMVRKDFALYVIGQLRLDSPNLRKTLLYFRAY